jgi:hypothetical protein
MNEWILNRCLNNDFFYLLARSLYFHPLTVIRHQVLRPALSFHGFTMAGDPLAPPWLILIHFYTIIFFVLPQGQKAPLRLATEEHTGRRLRCAPPPKMVLQVVPATMHLTSAPSLVSSPSSLAIQHTLVARQSCFLVVVAELLAMPMRVLRLVEWQRTTYSYLPRFGDRLHPRLVFSHAPKLHRRPAAWQSIGISMRLATETYDGWVRREGYGEPDLSERSFQWSSLFIV